MSTTFNIIPTKPVEITFGQVLETSERNIHAFLNSMGIEQKIRLKITLHEHKEKYIKKIPLTDKFEWQKSEYVWFAIEGVAGGTDAYCNNIKDIDTAPENAWWKIDELELNHTTIENIHEKLEKAKAVNRLWSFRRSAGQPGIVALSYGLISASVAALTNGLLWSDDGAWDYRRFPAESKDFFDWYFRPDKALDADHADWAARCIDGIKIELTAPDNSLPKAGPTWWQKLFGDT